MISMAFFNIFLISVYQITPGFITVNKEFNSNMFFWYFPSEHEPDTSPLLIWLQVDT